MIYEINVEMIRDSVYVSIDDMLKLCEGSLKSDGCAFDQALSALIKQLNELKTEAIQDIRGH